MKAQAQAQAKTKTKTKTKTKAKAKAKAQAKTKTRAQAKANVAAGWRRYVAFLRGVSPMNAKMAELKRCFEVAGFSDVKTVIGSGNVVFSAKVATEAELERKAEAVMRRELGREFLTIVRSVDALERLIAADPFAQHRLATDAKCVVTFVRGKVAGKSALRSELDGARILAVKGGEIFTAYRPSPRGPVFMTLIEKTFGTAVTTRTWDTVKKVVK